MMYGKALINPLKILAWHSACGNVPMKAGRISKLFDAHRMGANYSNSRRFIQDQFWLGGISSTRSQSDRRNTGIRLGGWSA